MNFCRVEAGSHLLLTKRTVKCEIIQELINRVERLWKKSVKWRQDGDNFFLTTLIKYVKIVTFCLGHACRGFLVLGEWLPSMLKLFFLVPVSFGALKEPSWTCLIIELKHILKTNKKHTENFTRTKTAKSESFHFKVRTYRIKLAATQINYLSQLVHCLIQFS